ncbi:MAG: CARDB domain-containing protein [Bacteroidota bacterium]
MKRKVTLALICFLLIAASGYSQIGSSCSTPHDVTSLPFVQSAMNTTNGGNPFDSTMACQSSYMNGKDYIFAYTPTTDEIVNIALTGTGQAVGLFVTNQCPSAVGASCIAEVESLTGNPTANSINLHHDTTYFIIVSTRTLVIFGQTFNNTTAFNISITSVNPNDLVLSSILKPQSGCSLSLTDTVKVKVRNSGQVAAAATQIAYSLNGGLPVIESLPASIIPGDSVIFNFAQLADLSSPSDIQLKVWIVFPADGNHANDTLSSTITHLPMVSAFPYLQNFESGAGGWYANGTGSTWALGTPNFTSITAAASGTNAWVTNLTGNSSSNEISYLYSPCLNFTSLTLPIIRLKTNYAMSASILANATLQTSTDQGQTWTTVGAQDPNWYTSALGWSGTTNDAWVSMKHTLNGLGGNSSVRVRIAFNSGFTAIPGIGIDDIEIYDSPANDLSVIKINSPISSCGLGTEQISIRVKNLGTASQSNYSVAYKVNTGSFVTQLQAPALASGDSVDILFTTTYNFSTPGSYNLHVKTVLATDTDNSNDTLSAMVTSTPAITSFPYFESFETGDGGWVPGGTSPSWQLGLPAGTVIQGAATGTNAWATNLTGLYNASENSYLESPCVNLSTLTLPVIEIMMNYDAGFGVPGFPMGTAYGYIEYSIDNGATWTTLGANGDLVNWYNGSLTTGWTGNSNGWVLSKHTAPALAGQSNAKIRFHFNGVASAITQPTEGFAIDNIRIYEMPQKDLSVVSITSPNSNCNLSTEYVSVRVANLGAAAQSNVPIRYTINGGTSYVTGSITGPINPNDTILYSFATPANFSTLQSYDVRIFTDLVGDENRLNDTIRTTIINAPVISAFPYLEGFETTTHNWIAGGTNSSWAVGNITNQTIATSPDGKCWVTNPAGLHNANEDSWVNSPCFNFSTLTNPYIKLNISYDTYNASNPLSQLSTILEISTNGGLSWSTVGVTGDSTNWYNATSLVPGFGSEGWQGYANWGTAIHLLNGAAGINNVKLRIHFGNATATQLPGQSSPTAGFAFDQVVIKNCDDPTLTFNTTTVQKTVTFNNTSVGATSYIWDFGDGTTANTTSANHTYANWGQYTVKLIGFNECTSDTITQVINLSGVGIDVNSSSMSINCSPNPTTGKINLKFYNINSKEITLSIVDLTNKTIYTEQLSNDNVLSNHQLDLSSFSKGVYFIKISTSKSTIVNKIILQ